MRGKIDWLVARVYFLSTVPFSVLFVLRSSAIHSSYHVSGLAKIMLGVRMFRNSIVISRGTSFKATLAMALKLLETPPTEGLVVECGTWKGGSAANLSLVCRITGRTLRIYDSFRGLPPPETGDREAPYYQTGEYAGSLDEVRANIRRYGALECCEFVEGWFRDTMPSLSEPIVLAYLDVDLEASLDTCMKYIWPCLERGGFVFTDECTNLDYVALFYSERWWRENFDETPPGLVGAGTWTAPDPMTGNRVEILSVIGPS